MTIEDRKRLGRGDPKGLIKHQLRCCVIVHCPLSGWRDKSAQRSLEGPEEVSQERMLLTGLTAHLELAQRAWGLSVGHGEGAGVPGAPTGAQVSYQEPGAQRRLSHRLCLSGFARDLRLHLC